MKHYISISVLDNHKSIADCVNALLQNPIASRIYVQDLTISGFNLEIKRFLKSYQKYGVFFARNKRAGKTYDKLARLNLGIAGGLLHFNQFGKGAFDTFTHVSQNIVFKDFDLQKLLEKASLYNAISPVVESLNGLEVYQSIFDRFGIEYLNLDQDSLSLLTGEVEETFALNPKCFSMSQRFANKIDKFPANFKENPVRYLNNVIIDLATQPQQLDSSLFIHENLY